MAAIGPLVSFVTANAGAPAAPVAGAALGAAKDALGQAGQPAPQAASIAPVPAAPSLEAILGAIVTVTNGTAGLASLLSDLQALAAKQSGIPSNVRDAANALLATQADASDARVDANTIKSGVVHSAVQTGEGKSALLDLRDALRTWPEGGKLAPQLLAKTDNAIARHDLLQVASHADPQSDKPMRLVFDIPLQVPQGPVIAQIAIEREGKKDDTDPQQKTWRVSFSIDLDALGPVHASIAMQGGRAAVTLLAERGDSANQLREGLPQLQAAFGKADLEPGDLQCREGAPLRPAGPGVLMDRAT